jgi:hypothetical protein
MGKDKDLKLLAFASAELEAHITKANNRINKKVNSSTETEPDWYDYQTCQELLELARDIETDSIY